MLLFLGCVYSYLLADSVGLGLQEMGGPPSSVPLTDRRLHLRMETVVTEAEHT